MSVQISLVITNICIGWIPFHLRSVKHKHDNDDEEEEQKKRMSTKYVYQNAPRLKFESYNRETKHELIQCDTNISINQSKQL